MVTIISAIPAHTNTVGKMLKTMSRKIYDTRLIHKKPLPYDGEKWSRTFLILEWYFWHGAAEQWKRRENGLLCTYTVGRGDEHA